MFTDIVGYTSLTQADEESTKSLLDEHRALLRPIFASHGGREVKTIGDAFLLEFPSALDAVRCAIEVQRAISGRDLKVGSQKLQLRIGIHVGEVIYSDGDIFGDAVNVASRIEPLAEPGGICISRSVFELIQNKIEAPTARVGPVELKNVKAPVEIYKVQALQEAGVKGMSESAKKRVAVLPLANFSPEPSDEYFADGLTEELIGTLSKVRELSVISRTSVMQYKGRPKPISEIGRELNAGTILEGSVRKAGNRARVSIQMIDSADDRHLWAENYDRDLQDIFSVQSDIATKVAEALKVQLLAGEKEMISGVPTTSPEAYTLFLKAVHEGAKGSPVDFERAIAFFEQAVEVDPQFAYAYATIALYYVSISGETMPGSKAFPKAKENLAKALSLNPRLAEAHVVKGWVAHQYDWNWPEAEASFREAISIMPSLALAHQMYGRFLAMLGRFDEALSESKRALELDPVNPFVSSFYGLVCSMSGNNVEARKLYGKALGENPDFAKGAFGLAMVDLLEGKKEEAVKLANAVVVPGAADEAYFRTFQALICSAAGQPESAREVLANILKSEYKGFASSFTTGAIYYLLGDRTEGYRWAEKSFEERDPGLVWYNKWPILNVMREDPRFMELLRRVNLP